MNAPIHADDDVLSTGDNVLDPHLRRLLNGSFKFAIMPINMGGVHWTVCTVEFGTCQATCYNSMGNSYPKQLAYGLNLILSFPPRRRVSYRRGFITIGSTPQQTATAGSGSCGVVSIDTAACSILSAQGRSAMPRWTGDQSTSRRLERALSILEASYSVCLTWNLPFRC